MNLVLKWPIEVLSRGWVNSLVSEAAISIHVCEVLIEVVFDILEIESLDGARLHWDSLLPVPCVVFVELAVIFAMQGCLILILKSVFVLLHT